MLSAPLLRRLLWPEWRQAPGRVLVALLAVALGVALAYSVHLINASALAEFAQAVRSANGQADLELRGDGPYGVPEAVYTRAAMHPDIEIASPVVEARTVALVDAPSAPPADEAQDGSGKPGTAATAAAAVAAGPSSSSSSGSDSPARDGASGQTRGGQTGSARAPAGAGPARKTVALTVLGLDALIAPRLAVDLLPRPAAASAAASASAGSGGREMTVLSGQHVFLNAAARRALGAVDSIQVQAQGRLQTLTVAGEVGVLGAPTLVMDIAGAQALWGRDGAISRVDLRLAPGADRAQVLAALELPAGVRAAAPDERSTRLSNLSRAYRVNLTVLALVALFTGGFLVFSVQSLAVAKRVPQLALLGVLGLDARARLQLVLIESGSIGILGGMAGLALGAALAWLALRVLGGDLGSGFFNGMAPQLAWSLPAMAVHVGLGLVAAVAGGWLPARLAQQMAPAQSLKGLGTGGNGDAQRTAPQQRRQAGPVAAAARATSALTPPPVNEGAGVGSAAAPASSAMTARLSGPAGSAPGALEASGAQAAGQTEDAHAHPSAHRLPALVSRMAAGVARHLPLVLLIAAPMLASLPPFGEVPLPAYAAVACLLFGGIASVPALVAAVLHGVKPPRHPIWLLAVERARDQRHTATVAVAGVVASLALSVALTVMVASFRDSVSAWLNQVLPADVYARPAGSTGASDNLTLTPAFIAAVQDLPGVLRVQSQRVVALTLDAQLPPVALIARSLDRPERDLPLTGRLAPPQSQDPTPDAATPRSATLPEVYVSEAMVDLYGTAPGTVRDLVLPQGLSSEPGLTAPATLRVYVRGIWRDYARQHGSVVIDRAQWQRLTGDRRSNDLALWLQPDGPGAAAVSASLQQLARERLGAAELLEVSTPGEIRALSLRIFDRSFAVTYWLQAVAIGIGLFGIAASFSAQVLARRREFGALQHLGFTRGQVLKLVIVEGLIWTSFGALLGLLLGLAISVILVQVVNPQSFHWTMDMSWPLARLAGLAAVVVLAGGLTAWVAGRAAAGRQMALAVKEDW